MIMKKITEVINEFKNDNNYDSEIIEEYVIGNHLEDVDMEGRSNEAIAEDLKNKLWEKVEEQISEMSIDECSAIYRAYRSGGWNNKIRHALLKMEMIILSEYYNEEKKIIDWIKEEIDSKCDYLARKENGGASDFDY